MSAEKLQLEPTSQWEWDGNFAKAAENGAQFALFLAMQFGASVGEPHIKPQPEAKQYDADSAARLNFYRRPALSAEHSDVTHRNRLANFINQGDVTSARLQDAMHPEPLSFYNDNKRLPDDIIANCSLATQRRLKGEEAEQIQEDNTLLDDIISQANDFMAA